MNEIFSIFSNKLDERAIESQQFYKSSDEEVQEPTDSIPSCSEVLQTEVHEVTPPACEDIAISTDIGKPTEADISVPIEEPVKTIEPITAVSLSISCKMLYTIIYHKLNNSAPIFVAPPPETDMNCDDFDELVNAKITDARGLLDQIDAEYPGLKKNVYIDYDFGNEEKVTKLDQLQKCVQAQLPSRMNPRIKGCSNSIIDLDSGDVLADQNAGVDDLFQRFLKHSTKPTKTNTQDMRWVYLQHTFAYSHVS